MERRLHENTMKAFWKKHYKKLIILPCDLMCILSACICGPLSGALLQNTNRACAWTLLGFECLTCGGTHFVNDLFAGRIGAAFMDNQLLFCITVYLALSMIFLNLFMLFDLAFAKKVLKWMYNIPVLIVFCVSLIVFLVARNWAAAIALVQRLMDMAQHMAEMTVRWIMQQQNGT